MTHYDVGLANILILFLNVQQITSRKIKSILLIKISFPLWKEN